MIDSTLEHLGKTCSKGDEYLGLVEICEICNFNFDPENIMMYACPASRAAIQKVFPSIKVLMIKFI